MTQLVIAFHSFANAPKNVSFNVMKTVGACMQEDGGHFMLCCDILYLIVSINFTAQSCSTETLLNFN